MNSENQALTSHNLDMLKVQLTSTDADDRRWAVYELENYETSQVLDLLLEAIRDSHRAVREAASEVLETADPHLCSQRLAPLLGSERIEVRNIVAGVLVKYGNSAVETLIDSLSDQNEDVRKFSSDILGLARSVQAVPYLCNLANEDEVKNVAVSAVEALGKIGQIEALPTLMGIVESDSFMKPEAYEAIGLIGSPNSAKYLVSRLQPEDAISSFAIVDALGNLGDPSSIATLMDYLTKTLDFMQPKVVSAVLKIGRDSNRSVLEILSPLFKKVLIEGVEMGDRELEELLLKQMHMGIPTDMIEYLYQRIQSLPASIIVALLKASRENKNYWDNIMALATHTDDWIAYTALEAFELMPIDLMGSHLINTLENSSGIRLLAGMSVCENLQLLHTQPALFKLAAGDDREVGLEAQRILDSWQNVGQLG